VPAGNNAADSIYPLKKYSAEKPAAAVYMLAENQIYAFALGIAYLFTVHLFSSAKNNYY